MSWLSDSGTDQYYLFTTRLTALGYQRAVMRAVAACSLSLGVPSTLALLNPASAGIPSGPAPYGVIAVFCGLLAWPWLRHRWPSRTESTLVVLFGSTAMAIGCSIAADPLTGLVTASAFPFILGFTALFHRPRLLAVPVTLAALTVAYLTIRIGADSLWVALAMATPVVMICVVVTFACRTIASLGGSGEAHDNIDPVTGLLNRDAFYERAAVLFGARDRDDDRYLVLAVVGIDGLGLIASLYGPRGVSEAQVAAGRATLETVRRTAVVGQLDDSGLLIADTFTVPDSSPLAERVRGAIAGTGLGITASVGMVSTPLRRLAGNPPAGVLDEVIALAAEAMRRARGGGGNQARFVLNPDLRSGEDSTAAD